MAILEVKNLGISFGGLRAVDDFNLEIEKGQLYGLIGPNGAGKTTTMKMLLGLTKPTSGEIRMWGEPLRGNEKKLLPRIGCLIETRGFYPNLTATENLHILPLCGACQTATQ